ncbi:hypothetical protein AJ80_05743 [Polytolypa hystricis UAMH7299]|uniref:Unsaturated glucuronyl hydrolase n=1 Tax=Polytolypa hystricis (strain UAMH7299) TaxID=1447883 RepID=A0A2B7Y0X2_POLH7|nr:hypothetical protein AJ80_05743 [Polytolypa hystricis UAMH7299]
MAEEQFPSTDCKGVRDPGSSTWDWESELHELFAENVTAKIWKVAARLLEEENPPRRFPEYVLTTGPDAGKYTLREASFWTCGFFPGSLYALLERSIRFPHKFLTLSNSYPGISNESTAVQHQVKALLRSELNSLCRAWSAPIHAMASRTDTHDMGFIILPSLRADWELNGNEESLNSVLQAAESLASRFNERVGAIRSWDKWTTKKREITSLEDDFLVIIDGMCNLDLLFYAAHHSSSARLISLATAHADTMRKTLLRPESLVSASLASYTPDTVQSHSTFHVANLCPHTGTVKGKFTAQGYADESTWARGQAWGIMGFAQTFHWTKEKTYLDAAAGLTEYFIARLENAPDCVDVLGPSTAKSRLISCREEKDDAKPLRDSSAGVIAANGLLLLYSGYTSLGQSTLAKRYLDAALRIITDTLALCLAPGRARLVVGHDGVPTAVEERETEQGQKDAFEAILMHATVNYNMFDYRRYWDHGLVYADYFLLEFGNKLLRYGLV